MCVPPNSPQHIESSVNNVEQLLNNQFNKILVAIIGSYKDC